MPMILRLIKGSELTFAELDGNFTDLDNRTDALEALNLGTRVTRLEAAGTPIYYDSDDTEVILDSIWGGTVASYLATTDSIGLASYDSSRFSLTDGHVTLDIATTSSVGVASFNSNDFTVSAGGEVSSTGGGSTNGAVGTYAFMSPWPSTTGYAFGATESGSVLRPCSAAGGLGFGPYQTGTWRCMGSTIGAVVATEVATLWLRIS